MSPDAVRSRRALLSAAAGAVAATAATAIAGPASALAAGDDGDAIRIGHNYPDTRATTTLRKHWNTTPVLDLENTHQDGVALNAFSNSGQAANLGSQDGVAVYVNSGNDTALVVTGGSSRGPAALFQAKGGPGVVAFAPGYAAVVGANGGGGTGVLGFSGDEPPRRVARDAGVYGASEKGRGGIFKGNVAQLRLVPSAATTHPSSGQIGDLFVDKSGRLWFCKGGTTWKQVA